MGQPISRHRLPISVSSATVHTPCQKYEIKRPTEQPKAAAPINPVRDLIPRAEMQPNGVTLRG
jgi:hypothetical protein